MVKYDVMLLELCDDKILVCRGLKEFKNKSSIYVSFFESLMFF